MHNEFITATLVPEWERLDTSGKHFGIRYHLLFEFAMQHHETTAIRAAIN